MTENPRWSYRRCPGVPGLVPNCFRRLRTRDLCEDCAKSLKAGRMVGERRCLGVPEIMHACGLRVRSKPRCRACAALYQKYQANVARNKSHIERLCLRCDKKFVTYNKFIRLCKSCKETNNSAEYAGFSEEHYSINIRSPRNGGY